MMLSLNPDTLCAVIVTYHPDPDFAVRLTGIVPQVARVVIVDNGSSNESLTTLNAVSVQEPKIHVIYNYKNFGIARALNQGMAWGKDNGYSGVITFDQDSRAMEGLVRTMCEVYNTHPERDRIAVIGINHINPDTQQPYFSQRRHADEKYVERKTVVTSGSLLPLVSFQNVGPYREEFFIDGVDHEYCLRARARGYKVILILEPFLIHSMGSRTKYKIPLTHLAIEAANYRPERWYFMTRNRFRIVGEYLLKDTWAITRLIRFLGTVVIMLIFEKNRWAKIKFACLGFRDFLTGNFQRTVL